MISIENPKRILTFKERVKWTIYVILVYLFLSSIPIYGISPEASSFIQHISMLLGGTFGSIVSLGVGPIVLASIILMLLMGGDVLKIDITTPEGKALYDYYQKILAIIFIIIESLVHVTVGWLKPISLEFLPIVFLQLVAGGFIILLLDELSTKYGLAPGVNLFILAAISKSFFTRFFVFLTDAYNNIVQGNITNAFLSLGEIFVALLVLILAAYLYKIYTEIPIPLGRVKGRSYRIPVKLLYTSVIPVIFLFALWANLRFWAWILQGTPIGKFIATFDTNGNIVGGILLYITPPNILYYILTHGSISLEIIIRSITYFFWSVIGCAIFSYLWIFSSGMDPVKLSIQISQAFPFRDERLIQRVLERYIIPISILGGAAVGFLNAVADIFGSLLSGISLLLAIAIAEDLYENVIRPHWEEIKDLFKFSI